MNTEGTKEQLRVLVNRAVRYQIILFAIGFMLVYGFVLYRINTLTGVKPIPSVVSAQTNQEPHIDKATVDKVQQLQNNSVSVQALFENARNNPFQESN